MDRHPVVTSTPTSGPAGQLYYRPLQPGDFASLKELHARLFPIDYDDVFYTRAVHSQDRIFSWAAVHAGADGSEVLVGAITARTLALAECDSADRHYMGLAASVLDHDPVCYILTLGVNEAYRKCGIASSLIRMTTQHSTGLRCRSLFLHVITYNTAAIGLYSRQAFTCVGRLENFYHISTGRQPDPHQTRYDAFLFVCYLQPPAPLPLAWSGGVPSAQHWLEHVQACMPWAIRCALEQWPHSCLGPQGGGSCPAAAGSRTQKPRAPSAPTRSPTMLQWLFKAPARD